MVPGKQRGTLMLRRTDSDASHTIDEDERAEYTNFVNSVLAGDPDLRGRLPIPTDTMQIFEECRDGLMYVVPRRSSTPLILHFTESAS
jgi:plastin-1